MNLSTAERMARDEMRRHNLIGWRFEWDNARTRAGACHFHERKITLSRHLMANWSEDAVRDTLLHEIAHAIAGPRANHGPQWRRVAQRIGCTADRCWSPSEDAPELSAPWIGTCSVGHTYTRFRRPGRGNSCGKCSRSYNPEYPLRWRRNPEYVG